MAVGTYDPIRSTAKDRVRFMVCDKAAPFVFDDEEILSELVRLGFVGDPKGQADEQEGIEIRTGINILEALPSSSSSAQTGTTTLKMGDQTFTTTGATLLGLDRDAILSRLRRRLGALPGASGGRMPLSGIGTGANGPSRERCRRWGYGD